MFFVFYVRFLQIFVNNSNVEESTGKLVKMRNLYLPERKNFVIYPVHDFGFKALMGHKLDPENMLIKDFLKALFKKEFEIIEFKDREITPSHILGKTIRLDLRVQCEGVLLNVEMQMFPTGNESERALYYACVSIESQAMEGKNYEEMEAIHQVVLLANNTREFRDAVEHFGMLNIENGRPLTEKLKISMISLERVVDEIEDYTKMTDLQKWCLFLREGHTSEHHGIKILMEEERFRKAAIIMRMVNEDEMLKDAAFQKMKDELDRRTRTHNELKQARAEGLEIGKTEVAFEMIKRRMDVQFISEVTGVSIELLKQIQNEEKHQK